MAKHSAKSDKASRIKRFQKLFKQYANLEALKVLFRSSKYLDFISAVLLICEAVLGVLIIQNVKYTEIDWKAYMQEVEGFLNGTLDYSYLRGDTGPLVYPAGFVYIFSFFYFITKSGKDIKLAQYLFLALYILFLYLVFCIYRKSKKVPAYCLVLMCFTTYRIHSLFVLRLFNDPIAVLLLYASLNLILNDKWSLGSLMFSLAVSVKMNILLYAPALLLAYLHILGIMGTIKQLFICASVQLILGFPFLLHNPYAYLKGSFDLGRVFLYQWTVNWRFIPEHVFLNRLFHTSLIFLHILILYTFYPLFSRYFKSYASLKAVQKDIKKQLNKKTTVNMDSVVQLFLFPFFTTNFIGIVCSRSLHYQFYVWYYHSLPYLLWCTKFSVVVRLTLLGVIELCWNTYPSTTLSSVALFFIHMTILFGLYVTSKSNLRSVKT